MCSTGSHSGATNLLRAASHNAVAVQRFGADRSHECGGMPNGEGSHRFGGTIFPHELERAGPEAWTYRDGRGGEAKVDQLVLTGPAGYAAMWHACTLHGTQPDAADHERISLRYLLARGSRPDGMEAVNATLAGPLSLAETRKDLSAEGAAILKTNTVNQA